MMRFHFLNVGHGDCTFVELPSGRLMLVDINNCESINEEDIQALAIQQGLSLSEFRRPGSYNYISSKSWEDYYRDMLVNPYNYYHEKFSGKPIFRYVQTHPDMDHMSGLHRFFWQGEVPLWNFWDISHGKELESEDFNGRHSETDWLIYQLLSSGCGPKDMLGEQRRHKVINNLRFANAPYWKNDGIHVLSPAQHLIDECNEEEKWNNASYVLCFDYGGRSVILAGDAEQNAWQSILDEVRPDLLNCDILKAAHHGRKSGYHDEAMDIMNPHGVICSVGKKPDTDAHQDYKNQGAEVFSTRHKGTMIVTIWRDGEVWVDDSNGNRLMRLAPLDSSQGALSYA